MTELRQLMAAYFHQDWDYEYDSWEAAVDDFVRREPSRVAGARAQITELLAQAAEETVLREGLQSLGNYRAAGDGHEPCRSWLRQVHLRLDQMTSSEELVHAMVDGFPALRSMLARHLEDEGELLPYLFMGDVADWAAAGASTDPAAVTPLVTWLEEQFALADGAVKNLIGVGFVEMLPATPVGDPILRLLGPTLRQLADAFGLFLPRDAAPGSTDHPLL